MDPVAEYREILNALSPYLDDLVIIGGVAVRLYHFHANQKETVPPVQTKDLDFATPRRLPVRGRPLLDRLLVESGLKSKQTTVVGRHAPKVKYNLQVGEGEIEFLTELRGNEREEPALVQEGLFAERLRYLGLLLEAMGLSYASLTRGGSSFKRFYVSKSGGVRTRRRRTSTTSSTSSISSPPGRGRS